MDEIPHHLGNSGILIPLQNSAHNGALWFQSGAGFRPSTVGPNATKGCFRSGHLTRFFFHLHVSRQTPGGGGGVGVWELPWHGLPKVPLLPSAVV